MQNKTGSCHCKKVTYEVEIDLTQPVIECNCSHCQIKGLLLSFVPENSFKLTHGEDAQTEYRFNTNKIQHLFCTTCGVQCFGKAADGNGVPTVAINVRTLQDIDMSSLNLMPYNGKDI